MNINTINEDNCGEVLKAFNMITMMICLLFFSKLTLQVMSFKKCIYIDTLTQCCFNAGPPSTMIAQYCNNTVSMTDTKMR